MKLRHLKELFPRLSRFMQVITIMALLLTVAVPFGVIQSTSAAQIQDRSVQLTSGSTGASDVSYNFSFSMATAGDLGSIIFEICSNYIYNPGDPCTAPTGFDAATATIAAQSGVTDFTVASQTANKIVVTRPAATPEAAQPLSIQFDGITNPDDIGSYYVRIDTYESLDGSGPMKDYGIVLFATNQDITITTEVPPYLMFCTGVTIQDFNCGTAQGSSIALGELSTTEPKIGTSQMLASTNAAFGYSVTMSGTTMTAGTNVIPSMNTEPSVPGTSQFGLNARANTVPGFGAEPFGPGSTEPRPDYNTSDKYRFRDGEILVSSDDVDDYRKFTVSYLVNRSPDQKPGRYVTTISYICLANF